MKINIYQFIEGAKKAEGLAVIIDVFRAFSTSAYLFANGAQAIYTVSEVDEARKLAEKIENNVLVGERNGIKLAGFDYGNSPYLISKQNFKGKNIILTTSAGTKGIINAAQAEEIITGSFVNVSAAANYIEKKDFEKISLVAMGVNAEKTAEEDMALAQYLKNKLEGKENLNQEQLRKKLYSPAGDKFFNSSTQSDMPEEDFNYCLNIDKFDFVIKAEKFSNEVYRLKKVNL
ncbi:2-phosphosulfolactate phosphatase [Halanaerobium sp. Z-7514]|uniref:Probable 2-phosphosulfolactate phosphatase n=1 Tax=Halanaerobium polyolivorans TaxID=2886943 RepID=A0AAW4X1W4_9FIRM|nr:2-phosphosulfolactate phosphatase [Halanaerobium polyolivorans]MCC3145748.1 2-phosphosulfolactate phosphatase [Halanaerobium polyolivorans]